jgi:carboxymethylenebutenolidase
MGGGVCFLAACCGAGAAVSFYGRSQKRRTPLLDLARATPCSGSSATSARRSPPTRSRRCSRKAKVASEVVRYADADHGFNCDARSSYHEASATDGWARMLAWFDQHIS